MLHEHKINIPSQWDKIAIFRWSWISGFYLRSRTKREWVRDISCRFVV